LLSFYLSMKKVFNGLKYIYHKFYEKVSKRQDPKQEEHKGNSCPI